MSLGTFLQLESVWEGANLVVMARGRDIDAALLLQANVTAITYHVQDEDGEVIAETGLTPVSSYIFDTLQTTQLDARWTKDAIGYNFRHILAPTDLPNGGKKHWVTYKFTDSSSRVTKLGIEAPVTESYV